MIPFIGLIVNSDQLVVSAGGKVEVNIEIAVHMLKVYPDSDFQYGYMDFEDGYVLFCRHATCQSDFDAIQIAIENKLEGTRFVVISLNLPDVGIAQVPNLDTAKLYLYEALSVKKLHMEQVASGYFFYKGIKVPSTFPHAVVIPI